MASKSAADILAAFRARTESKIAEAEAPDQELVLVSAADVRARKAREAEDWRRSLGYRKSGDDNDRRKRLLDDELGDDTRGKRRKGKGKGKGPRRPRTKKVKVSNIPSGIRLQYLQELFQKATGKIEEGRYDEENEKVAWFTFKYAEDAVKLFEEFDGGEISGTPIEVELLPPDDEDERRRQNRDDRRNDRDEDNRHRRDDHDKANGKKGKNVDVEEASGERCKSEERFDPAERYARSDSSDST
eukprot:TRINITY_DN19182_c0_g1_i1.p1 TRINITY_DN19182_c0_g1~~TRINITY_DN19182_c0_g1_i1.p1  ORF type:complete len:258 (-),score=63.57 TRINITY_DN19182_c0_g1_i1:206-937(-)